MMTPLLLIIVLAAAIKILSTPERNSKEQFVVQSAEVNAILNDTKNFTFSDENLSKYNDASGKFLYYSEKVTKGIDKLGLTEAKRKKFSDTIRNKFFSEQAIALDDDSALRDFTQTDYILRNNSELSEDLIRLFNSVNNFMYTWLSIIQPPVNERNFKDDISSLPKLIKQYEKERMAFLKDVTKTANKTTMEKGNEAIKTLLSNIHNNVMRMYPFGTAFQKEIADNNGALLSQMQKLEPIRSKFQSRVDQMKNAIGVSEATLLQGKSYQMRDYFYGLLAFIALVTVIYSLTNETPHSIEYVILAMAILVFVAQIYQKVANALADTTKRGLTSLGSAISGAFYN